MIWFWPKQVHSQSWWRRSAIRRCDSGQCLSKAFKTLASGWCLKQPWSISNECLCFVFCSSMHGQSQPMAFGNFRIWAQRALLAESQCDCLLECLRASPSTANNYLSAQSSKAEHVDWDAGGLHISNSLCVCGKPQSANEHYHCTCVYVLLPALWCCLNKTILSSYNASRVFMTFVHLDLQMTF